MKNWPEPKSIGDIQVFLGFANFYCYFISSLSGIAFSLPSMLKIGPTQTSARPELMDLIDGFGGGDCGENEARILPRWQKNLWEQIIYLLITSAIPSAILSGILIKTSIIT